MTMRTAQECACRVLDTHRADVDRKDRPFVIIATDDDVIDVRNMVSVSMPPGSECFGSTWRSPEGETVQIKRYNDSVPQYRNGFDLVICNGGRILSAPQREAINRWRQAARKVL
jgi:hypothetical protein